MSVERLRLDDFGTIPSSEFEPEFVKLDDFVSENGNEPAHSTDSPSSLEACTKGTVDRKDTSAVCTEDKGLQVLNYARRFGRHKLSKSEWVTWALRLEIEKGEKTPYPVNAPPLPEGVSSLAAKVYHGFIHLLEARWLHPGGEHQPAPYTYDFIAAWVGITPRQAKDGRAELKRIGAIVPVDRSRMAKLWLPGRPSFSPSSSRS